MRRLRALLGEPGTWVIVHGCLAGMWALLTIPALLWWRESVAFVVIASVYANFAGSVASFQAARADSNSPCREDVARLEAKLDALRGRVNLLVARRS